MSEEDVQLVREITEMFQRRQHDRALEYYADDVFFDARRTPVQLASGLYHGHDGVRAYWREWLSAWSDLQFEIEDVVEGTEGRVVLLIRNQRHWGKHSGIETAAPPYGIVFEIRDRKVVKWCGYPNQAEARKGAGLDG